MRFFFIDYENTHMSGLEGLEDITDDDFVYIFYNPKDTFPIKYLKPEILKHIEFVEPYIGHSNALDFQLISMVGYKLNDPYISEFIIVSKDNGYKPAAQFWCDRGFKVKVVHNVAQKEESVNQQLIIKSTTNTSKLNNTYAQTTSCKLSKNDKNLLQYIEKTYPIRFSNISSVEVFDNIEIVKEVITTVKKDKILNTLHNVLMKKYKNLETSSHHYQFLKSCITAKPQ